jgi:hypothetical protein
MVFIVFIKFPSPVSGDDDQLGEQPPGFDLQVVFLGYNIRANIPLN